MTADPNSPLPLRSILAALGIANATTVEVVTGGSDMAIWRAT